MSKTMSMISIEDGLILKGCQKKLKTMRKKFFVLYKSTVQGAARLEYYDSEKKFKSGIAPKRAIKLEDCFNINRRLSHKFNFVISLSMKDGAFGIVFETESEMMKWLRELTELQRFSTNHVDGTRLSFDSVWQVTVQKKGIAEDKGLVGKYHIGLTTRAVTFIRIGGENLNHPDSRLHTVEFLLTTIRRCGDSQCIFYMEVGRQSVIGPGEIWMETEDALTAENMHHTILNAMSAKTDANVEPMRKRSSSANEASKPINVMQRRQTHSEIKSNNSPQATYGFSRERCDSLPTRNRTTSECSNQNFNVSASAFNMRNGGVNPGSITATLQNTMHTGSGPNMIVGGGHRTHPTVSAYQQRHSHSPPVTSASILSCSENEETSMSIDETDDTSSFHPYRPHTYSRSSEGVIPEENTDELVSSENKADDCDDTLTGVLDQSYVDMAPIRNFDDSDDAVSQHGNVVHSEPVPLDRIRGLEFKECTVDNYRVNNKTQTLQQMDQRPTRTYSVGSKFEHNKLNNKRIVGSIVGKDLVDQHFQQQQSNNCNSMRVRAFSVGSRAKIPRCDLQRDVLLQKSYGLSNEQNNFFSSNSNNNIFAVSSAAAGGGIGGTPGSPNDYNQLLNISSTGGQQQTEKKSISAPLLLHKSQNSVDRMSDLMELDFSPQNQQQQQQQTTNAAQNRSNTMNYLLTQQMQQGRSFYNQNNGGTPTGILIPNSKQGFYSRSVPNAPFQRDFTTSIGANRRVETREEIDSDVLSSPGASITSTTTATTLEHDNFEKDSQVSPQSQSHQVTTTHSTDNGYLEMKPVGPQFNNKVPVKTHKLFGLRLQDHRNYQQLYQENLHHTGDNNDANNDDSSQLSHTDMEQNLPSQLNQEIVDESRNCRINELIRKDSNLSMRFNQLSMQSPNTNDKKIIISKVTASRPPTIPDSETLLPTIDNNVVSKEKVANFEVIQVAAIAKDNPATKTTTKYPMRIPNSVVGSSSVMKSNNTNSTSAGSDTSNNSNGEIANRLQSNRRGVILAPTTVTVTAATTITTTTITTTPPATITTIGGAPNFNCQDTGYEILQIRSDSSLQAPKNCNRLPTAVTAAGGKENNTTSNWPQSNNISDNTMTNSITAIYHSNDITTKIAAPTTTTTATTNLINNTANNAITDVLPKNSITSYTSIGSGNNNSSSTSPTSQGIGGNTILPSRPSSVSSDYELYYAHLDLPQCSSGDSIQTFKNNGKQQANKQQATTTTTWQSGQRPNIDTTSMGSQHTTPDVNNSYAKIDFEFSDSLLSSSSKNANI